MNASRSSGATPPLPGSRDDVDLDQDAQAGARQVAVKVERAQRGLARERVDQTHVRHNQAHAPALQLPDEIPFEQLSVGGRLRLRGPARGSRPQV